MAGGRSGPRAVLAVLALAALAVAASAVATAHGNHVTATTQVVGDGAVVVESAYTVSGGWIAIAVDDGGSPGDRIGHVRAPIGAHRAVEVPIDTERVPSSEPTQLWAVLHGEDGDGEFDPDRDAVARSFSGTAEESFAVERGAAATAVVAPSLESQPTNGTVEIRRVSLGSDGHVAIHAEREPTSDVLGHETLAAGTHENRSVTLDPETLADRPRRFSVWAVAYADDGDGEFGSGDEPVAVDGQPVRSRIDLTKVEDCSTGNGSDGSESGFDPSIVTPTPGPDATDGKTGANADDSGDGTGADGSADHRRADSGGGIGPLAPVWGGAIVAIVLLAIAAGGFAVQRRR